MKANGSTHRYYKNTERCRHMCIGGRKDPVRFYELAYLFYFACEPYCCM